MQLKTWVTFFCCADLFRQLRFGGVRYQLVAVNQKRGDIKMKRYLVVVALILGVAALMLACAGDQPKEETGEKAVQQSDALIETHTETDAPHAGAEAAAEEPNDTLIDTLKKKAQEETSEADE
jgi:hypothetical protein